MPAVVYDGQRITTIVFPDEIRDFPEQTRLPTLCRDLKVVGFELEIMLKQLPQSIHLESQPSVLQAILQTIVPQSFYTGGHPFPM